MPTTVIVVRHGQSQSNINGTYTGHMDSPLTDLGHQQAKNTAEYLKDYPISAIYSSDLSRAMQTAEPVAKMHGLPIYPDGRLREICCGEWEGKNVAEISLLYPDNYEMWKTDIYRGRPDGGESIAEVAIRTASFMRELLSKHKNECVAIFTHALAARTISCQWFDMPIEKIRDVPSCTNASVSIGEYDDDGVPHVLLYGYDAHQGELSTALSKGLA